MLIKQFTMAISNKELCERAARIKWFFCDIDGTLTDGNVYYSPDGELLKKFSLRDGTGFFLLRQCGVKTGFITTEESPIVAQRAKKLNIDKYIYGTHKKLAAMQEFVAKEGISLEEIAFIGDDLNDVKLLSECGLSFAVGDSSQFAKDAAHIICTRNGGYGAFREAVERFLGMRDVDINSIVQKSL